MDTTRNSCPFNFAIISLFSFFILWTLPVTGQNLKESSSENSTDRIEGNIKFLPIPYINYDRSLGYQIGAAPAILFNPEKKDTLSPSSMAGVMGIYSENKTWFAMAFLNMHLNEDNWRFTAAGGLGSYHFQFFLDTPINSWIPYNTKLDFIFAQIQRRIVEKLYAGISLIHMSLKTETNFFEFESNSKLNGLGLLVSMDQRSSTRYPLNGFKADVKLFTYPEFLDNKNTSNKIEIAFNHFIPVREQNDVLAGRIYAGLGLGDLNFNQQLIVGRKDIRGYTQGGYRGNYLLAVQSEYRWNFSERWGTVYFLGLATVFKAVNKDDNGKLLPGLGTGIRYTIDTETRLNAGIDIAAGIDDWGVYFRIGEAF